MLSKRIAALAILALMVLTSIGILYNSFQGKSAFPKYNRFYYMKEYMEEIEAFLQENFPLADRLTNAAVKLRMEAGEKEFDNIFVGDDILIEDIGQPKEELLRRNLGEIQSFVELNSSTPTYVLYLPTKYAIKQQELPDNAELFALNQKSFIEEGYSDLVGKATTVDVYSSLLASAEQYLYYRTDPNLTALGAYTVYGALVQRMGLEPLGPDRFRQQHVCHDFYGETYQDSRYKDISADIITLYHPDNQSAVTVTHDNDYPYTYNTLYPQHCMELSSPLSVLLGGDTGNITIRSGLKRQRSLLVFGDSSFLPVLPLLSAHFSTIRFVDFEFWNDRVLEDLDIDDYDQVLLAYSVETMIRDPYPAQLRRVRQHQQQLSASSAADNTDVLGLQ